MFLVYWLAIRCLSSWVYLIPNGLSPPFRWKSGDSIINNDSNLTIFICDSKLTKNGEFGIAAKDGHIGIVIGYPVEWMLIMWVIFPNSDWSCPTWQIISSGASSYSVLIYIAISLAVDDHFYCLYDINRFGQSIYCLKEIDSQISECKIWFKFLMLRHAISRNVTSIGIFWGCCNMRTMSHAKRTIRLKILPRLLFGQFISKPFASRSTLCHLSMTQRSWENLDYIKF